MGKKTTPRFAKNIGHFREREKGSPRRLEKKGNLITISELTKKTKLNNMDPFEFRASELFDVEYLYMRQNRLSSFTPNILFPNLKILDLSCNKLENLDFLKDMPVLRHLMLSCNELYDFSQIPQINTLETLSLSKNMISSFEGLKKFPNLKVLNLRDNYIASFAGYPSLPNLQNLNLIGNPISDCPRFREMAIGIHTKKLCKLNGQVITREEREKSKICGGKVAICIRNGFIVEESMTDEKLEEHAWNFLRAYQQNLTKGFVAELIDIRLFGPAMEGEKLNLVPILKVNHKSLKCVSESLVDHTFEIKTEAEKVSLILNDNKIPLQKTEDSHQITVILPTGEYEISYEIDGKETEKSKVVVERDYTNKIDNYLQFDIQWSKYNNEMDEFDPLDYRNISTYIPTKDDCGLYIKGDLVCKDMQKNVLFTVFDISNPIRISFPVCKYVKLAGENMEDETLYAEYEYFGGTEGNSLLKWYANGELIHSGSKSYTITGNDIGKVIKFEYTPVRKEGNIVGTPVAVETDVIKPAIPKAFNLQCIGELKQDKEIEIKYDYKGGFEGATTIEWQIESGENEFVPLEFEQKQDEQIKKFTPGIEHIGKRLKIIITPREIGGLTGEAKYIITEPIEPEFPKVKSLKLHGTPEQYQELSVEYEYYGGKEGDTKVEWFRVSKNGEETLIPVNGNTYKLKLDDIYHRIVVKCTPVRSDGEIGKQKVVKTDIIQPYKPECVKIQLRGLLQCEETLIVSTKYRGGYEGKSTYEWFVSTNGETFEPLNINNKEFRISYKEANKRLKVVYTPIREDGVKGEPKEIITDPIFAPAPLLEDVKIIGQPLEGQVLKGSAKHVRGEPIGRNHKWFKVRNDIQIEIGEEETYNLTLDDINYKIIYAAQTIREDAISEWFYSEPFGPIDVRLPKIESAELEGEAIQDGVLNVYFDGPLVSKEKSVIQWMRDGVEICNETEYAITEEDIGYTLKVHITPYRDDIDVKGETVTLETEKIKAGHPRALSCELTGECKEGKSLVVLTDYYGGEEGFSKFRWYRLTNQDKVLLAQNNDKTSLRLTLEDVHHRIMVEYIPIREDNEVGEPVTCTSDEIVGDDPTVTDLKMLGEPIEGGVLRVTGKYSGGYEGKSSLIWHALDDKDNTEVIQRGSTEYQIKIADIGKRIRLTYTPISDDGRKGKEVSVTSEVVQARLPKVVRNKIQGNAYVSETISVKYVYDGGLEGKTIVNWMKSDKSDGPFTRISSEPSIRLNVDDLGKFIVAQIVPVRSDGVTGSLSQTTPAEVVLSMCSLILGSNQKGPRMKDRLRNRIRPTVADIPLRSTDNQEYVLHYTPKHVKVITAKGKRDLKLRYSDSMELKTDPTNDKLLQFITKKKSYNFLLSDSEERDFALLLHYAFTNLSDKATNAKLFSKQFEWHKKRGINIAEIDRARLSKTSGFGDVKVLYALQQ